MESYVTDKEIMILHINYEEEKPFPLKRIDIKAAEKKQKQKEFFKGSLYRGHFIYISGGRSDIVLRFKYSYF